MKRKIICWLTGHQYRGYYNGLWGITRFTPCRRCGKKYKEGDKFQNLYSIWKEYYSEK